jgi:fibronectin type 3 domain-containing protein
MLLRSLLVLLACLSLAFAATPAQAEQVQLAWDAPLQADGTLVSNVAGYKLYYGSQSGQYQTVVTVGLTTTYTVKHLSAGQTYYFAVKVYDSTGTESAFSNEISVILPTNTPGEGIIPQQQMRVVAVDSQEQVGENGTATNAIDGNATTLWHTAWSRPPCPPTA